MLHCLRCKGKGDYYKRDGDKFGVLGFGILNILDRMINTKYKVKCDMCNGKGFLTNKKSND